MSPACHNPDTQEEPGPLVSCRHVPEMGRDPSPSGLPSSSCSLVPSLLPHCPHSFSSHPPTPPLIGSHLGSSSPAALFLSLTLLCVLSDASPHLPPPPCVPPPLSFLPCPSPGVFSPQTFLASSGGLYCLGGGCGNVVIPGCMSLPSTPASSPPRSLHARAWLWLCMGWIRPQGLPSLRAGALEGQGWAGGAWALQQKAHGCSGFPQSPGKQGKGLSGALHPDGSIQRGL